MHYNKYGKLEINPSRMDESVTVSPSLGKAILTKDSFKESYGYENPKILMPKIEAIHAGTTKNFHRFPAHKLQGNSDLRSGVYSFVHPYPKPLIYNHDVNTKATGRIESAAFSDVTESGKAGIVVVPRITDPEAIESVLDRRLLTVSIGATVDGCTCSICGTDIINEGYCGHMKGEEYDGKTAEWIAGNIFFDELSWVNVPADDTAMVTDTQAYLTLGESNDSNISLHEKFNVPKTAKLTVVEYKKPKKEEVKEMDEKEIKEMKEKLEALELENSKLKASSQSTKVLKEEVEDIKTDEKEEDILKEEDKTSKPEDKNEIKPEDKVIENEEEILENDLEKEVKEQKELNISLLSENESLQKDLKALYINRVIESKEFSNDEEKETFEEKISKRTIESLKDMLEDLEFSSKKVEVKESTTRVVQKIDNPLDSKEEKTKSLEESTKDSQNDKIAMLAGMLGKKAIK